MGWKESSNGGNPKEPWGRRGAPEGPPDLDELLRAIQARLKRFLNGGSKDSRDGEPPVSAPGGGLLLLIGGALLVCWLVYDMFYIIDEQDRGLVLRFGAHVTTLQPGLSLRLPRPIERVYKLNVGRVRSFTRKASMLTQDENIVEVEAAVQYRIGDPEAYLFHVREPEATLREVTESAVREVIGGNELDFVLTEGRREVASNQQKLMQGILEDYRAGILIVGVEMQPAKPPEQVKAAFDDAIKAREDEQRSVNEAEAYRNDILPRARGAAARLEEEATAYRERVIAKAKGEASRFEQLLGEYQQDPEVTRQRLYLETVESMLSSTSKVLLDPGQGGNQLIYLPVDRLLERGAATGSREPAATPPAAPFDGSSESGRRQRPRL